MEDLLKQIITCSDLIAEGTCSIDWLNQFCAIFLDFASVLKGRLPEMVPRWPLESGENVEVETIFLCLTQVVTCIPHLERAINVESSQMTHQHFLDRIEWCLRRLLDSLSTLSLHQNEPKKLEDHSFVELLDLALDHLEDYLEKINAHSSEIEEVEETETGYELASICQHIVRHALAFANVAIDSDKKALSALCETLLSECATFHEEAGDRKLEALSLERAIYSLESFLNEALLHLLFASLIELDKNPMSKLKGVLQEDPDAAHELISSFDTNMDRIQQIGVLAIAFSQDIKTKTVVRSCLASLESLDECIVPVLQLPESAASTHHAAILEQHFNEELLIFRNVIHDIIDSCSLINNFLDMLGESVHIQEKSHLTFIVQMGNIVVEHFRLPVNYSTLSEDAKRVHKDFIVILGECRAIISLTIPIDPKRIVKRLKILYSVLAKLRNLISQENLELDNSVVSRSQKACDATRTIVKNNQSKAKRHRSFVKQAAKNVTFVQAGSLEDSKTNESDLISLQLTEMLKLQ
ncbi:hypothetical protein KR018_004651 [Drosophila ironensis]|nr:hypothetical protein KR018_004651 [Drosophila ironensis]